MLLFFKAFISNFFFPEMNFKNAQITKLRHAWKDEMTVKIRKTVEFDAKITVQ